MILILLFGDSYSISPFLPKEKLSIFGQILNPHREIDVISIFSEESLLIMFCYSKNRL